MDIGTAGPLVLHVLGQACSQQPEVLKPAEQQLKQWETQPGFYTILQTIWSNHSLDQNVRWLAVLFFKNGVDRYWRKTAPNAVREEEKAVLRQRLLMAIAEPVNQIATQLAVLTAKIARLDCPHNWPELFPTLLEAVKSPEVLLKQRALLMLYHVVKALASKRLAPDRHIFAELTASLFAYILTLWDAHTENTAKYIQGQGHADLLMSFDQSILALKVLRKLVVFGVKQPDKNESAITFVNLVFQRLEQFLTSKNEMQFLSQDLFPRREKVITLLTKVLLDLQENHPESYIVFIRPTFDLAVRYNFTDEAQGFVFERFTVNSLNLIRNILRCESYRPAKNIEDTKNPLVLEAHQIKLTYFNVTMLPGICRQLISHYFPLTPDDLEKWDADPEDFIADEGGDSWKFSLRPCVEGLFLTLMKEFWEVLTPVILSLMQEYQAPINFDDMNAILMKDAIYTAIGLASFDLYDDVDFNQWLQSHLLAELTTKHTNYRVLRRRVVWVIGCWVGVKMAPEMRPTMYEALLPLLQRSEDLVVRMEVANTLRIAIDDFEFKTEQFQPYLDSSFTLLFQLLKDVVECETKMQILRVISFIIERMQRQIRPHAAPLVQYLPQLWQESSEHNMLRCAILTTLTFLVQGLGAQSVSMYDFLIPVIQMSTDVTQDQHVYLCEDGVELWHHTLQHCPRISPQLIDLYTNIPPLLGRSILLYLVGQYFYTW
ncbi:hypothetical protein NP493_1346g00008 [Ridgeia piscesae]|uniref:Importin N-terminal domain-containing protein n=1 Tax=Ridgeia piscesae TaxID=27915 RepID=A0AAD9K8A8_RIDPI|nr:hypothetical protein NP493_1346g00008 [Ridgeia piscesae]